MKASIIIVTRNRAADLVQTIQSLRQVVVGDGLGAELRIVDNGSTDDTAQVVRSASVPGMSVQYSFEGQPGASHGRNRGLAEATGDVIVCTDDDVRPPPDWLQRMCEPILQRKASVVAGGVRLPDSLLRPWMTPVHRSYLASTEWLRPEAPHSMVGANMAFSREVLRRVPAFDPELGPGALGFGEEELFAAQLVAAGYEIFGRLDMCVEHHFHSARLKRSSWLDCTTNRGKVNAYLTHHWHGRDYRLPRVRLWWTLGQLIAWRTHFASRLADEGCSEQEMRLLFRCGELRQYLNERQRQRNYDYHGLVKRMSAVAPAT